MKRTSSFYFFLLTIIIVSLFTACSLSIKNGDSYVFEGAKAYQEEDYLLAEEDFKKAIEIGVKRYSIEQVYTMLGNTYCELEEYDKAIESHKKSVEINAEYCDAWVNMGVAYRKKGNYDEAEICYNKAMEINPSDAELRSSLGTLYLLNEQYDKAIAEFEKAIEINKNLAITYGNYAYALALAGRHEDAEKALKRSRVLGYQNADVIEERINNLKE